MASYMSDDNSVADSVNYGDDASSQDGDDTKVKGVVKRSGKRGRKPNKVDVKAKLERSRQSARECRARKKLRYQYLEELVACRERAILALREELDQMKQWCASIDKGEMPPDANEFMDEWRQHKMEREKHGASDPHQQQLHLQQQSPPQQQQPKSQQQLQQQQPDMIIIKPEKDP